MADSQKLNAKFYGYNQAYLPILELMQDLHDQVARGNIDHQLMLLEHAPVITITRQHQSKSLLSPIDAIKADGIEFAVADRGGDASFHGPGQLVGYPIIRLSKSDKSFYDLEAYVTKLEQALLHALISFGLRGPVLVPGFRGIWLKTRVDKNLKLRKICAIGVGISNGVSKHGFALNLNIDYERYTKHIIPCGLKDFGLITLCEAFSLESLPMPKDSVILSRVADSVAKIFSCSLSENWQRSLDHG